MHFKVKENPEYILIYLTGRLDVHMSSDIELELDKLRIENPNKDLILEMSDVQHISSSGLRVLVSLMRELENSGKKLKLCKLSKIVRKLFEVVELMDLFDIYKNESSAIKGQHS